MKKIMILLGVATMSATSFAQGGYVSFNIGYAMPAAKDVLGVTSVTDASSNTTETNIYGTLGGGIPVMLRGGYMCTENFGIELGASYFLGSKVIVDDNTSPGLTDKTEVQSKQMRLLPALVISTSGDGLQMYGRVGFMLPVSGKTTFERTITSTGITTIVGGEKTGKISLGYVGSFGVSYGLSDKLSLFGEIQGISLRVKTATQTLTTYTSNGTDIMSLMAPDVSDKETEYVDVVGPNDNTSSSSPKKELATTANYSSIGIKIGIKMAF